MHVAWGVDGIGQLFNDLQANGNDMRGDGPSASPFGYLTASIEPASSHGIYFQLAEGRAQLGPEILMEYTQLGRTGLTVSRAGFGGGGIGQVWGPTDEAGGHRRRTPSP